MTVGAQVARVEAQRIVTSVRDDVVDVGRWLGALLLRLWLNVCAAWVLLDVRRAYFAPGSIISAGCCTTSLLLTLSFMLGAARR